jgi:hypothetical protein
VLRVGVRVVVRCLLLLRVRVLLWLMGWIWIVVGVVRVCVPSYAPLLLLALLLLLRGRGGLPLLVEFRYLGFYFGEEGSECFLPSCIITIPSAS